MEWLNDSLFQDPSTMTDDELERESKALERWQNEVVNSEGISDFVRSQVVNHSFNVEQERRKREGESWMYPLSSFGIVDFL